METGPLHWTISKLSEHIKQIEFPEFQREATVWNLEKKQKLIDSILRGFDISAIYFHKKESGGYDCIDGRQRINAILSFLGINQFDEDDNGFNLKIENEIYDDENKYNDIISKRFSKIKSDPQLSIWLKSIMNYKLNIIEITDVEHDEELNLLFLRLQIASVLNAGEKLNAMTGDMKEWIFYKAVKIDYFQKINLPRRRFVKEQVAAQIALNAFSKQKNGTFQRSRFVDLQDFFKQYKDFNRDPGDKKIVGDITNNLAKIHEYFGKKLAYINNRALAVSVYLFASELLDQGKETDLPHFVDFFILLFKTLKWQVPKGINIDRPYQDLISFQSNISQAAGERTAIQRRHDFLNEYFYHFQKEHEIKGDKEYKEVMHKKPSAERDKLRI
ncbi:MAG: DUF262 domain-containing protein [Dissulfurispiraceae bacterium]